jgi:hypothetical protein
MKTSHNDKSNNTDTDSGSGVGKTLNVIFECDRCKNLFEDKAQLEAHIVSEHHNKIKGEDKVLSASSENLGDESGLVEEKYHQLFGGHADNL